MAAPLKFRNACAVTRREAAYEECHDKQTYGCGDPSSSD
jgi:hypothetical protein